MILAAYVVREHLAPFFYSLMIITFLFVIDFLMRLLEAILSKGLDIWVILELFALNMAWMFALSIPMSCLVASLLAFSRLSGDNELIAIRASGVSPFRVLLPVLLFAVLVCLALIYFNNRILPEANHRAAGLKADISRKNAPAFITPGKLIKDFPNYRLWVDSVDYKTGRLFRVKIYNWERREPPRYMYSSVATMNYTADGKYILIKLMDGENHIVDTQDPNRYLRVRFREQTVAIENVDPDLIRRDRRSRSDREMSVEDMYAVVEKARAKKEEHRRVFPERIFKGVMELDSLLALDAATPKPPPRLLQKEWWETHPVSRVYYRRLQSLERERMFLVGKYERSLRLEEREISKYLVEIHKKFSIPVACIVFVLAGGSLGMLSRRGSIGMGAVISAIFILIYWICLLGGETLADKLLLNPVLAMWAPNLIVGVFGVWLVSRLVRLRRSV